MLPHVPLAEIIFKRLSDDNDVPVIVRLKAVSISCENSWFSDGP